MTIQHYKAQATALTDNNTASRPTPTPPKTNCSIELRLSTHHPPSMPKRRWQVNGRTCSDLRKTPSWMHRRWPCIAPSGIRIGPRQTPEKSSEEQSHISKHDAPNRGATSRRRHRADPTESRLSPGDNNQVQTSEGSVEMTSTTPPRRGVTPTGAIAAGPARAVQDFHPIIAHLHTSKELGSTVQEATHRRHRNTSPL
jgi:hypothetical protein